MFRRSSILALVKAWFKRRVWRIRSWIGEKIVRFGWKVAGITVTEKAPEPKPKTPAELLQDADAVFDAVKAKLGEDNDRLTDDRRDKLKEDNTREYFNRIRAVIGVTT
jgi:hypothetical protein